MSRRRFPTALVPLLALAGWALVACGDDDDAAPTTPAASSTPDSSITPTSVVPATTSPTSPTSPTSTEAPASTATTEPTTASTEVPVTTAPTGLEQPAIWPAADVAFATPEQAATDFVAKVLGVPPELGEFMAGDARSGEIEVFSPGEGGPGSRVARSLLLLRRLGPDDGWFVIAAIDDHVSITAPEAGSTVPAGPLTVSGIGRGFEATIIVKVFVAGDPTPIAEPVIAAGGALEIAEPYSATVDLSGLPSGTTALVLVRGDTGLETDPGEFSALAVVIA